MTSAVRKETPKASQPPTPIGAHRQAWNRINGDPVKRRADWRVVGRHLAEGKAMTKAQRGGLKFSEWAEREFPGICVKNEVHAAAWFATEFPGVQEKDIPAGKHNPAEIRRWFNSLQPKVAPMPKSAKPDEDLSEAPEPTTVERKELTKDTARRVRRGLRR